MQDEVQIDAKCSPKIMLNVVKMNEIGGPKIIQNVVQNEWKLCSNAKCNPQIMQDVVQIWYKMKLKNNAIYSQKWMKMVVQK